MPITLRAMMAYLDPATSTMLLQAVVGAVAGVAVAGRLYWSRIKRGLRFGRTGGADTDDSR